MRKAKIKFGLEKLVKDAVDTLPFEVLTEKEKRVLRLRYNLAVKGSQGLSSLDKDDESEGYHSYKEVAEILGVKYDRVKKIHKRAISKLEIYKLNPEALRKHSK